MQTFIEKFGASIAVAFGTGLLLALVVLPATIHAQSSGGREAAQERRDERVELRAQAREAAQERRDAAKVQASEKREAAKIRACENKQRVVSNIMARIADRGERHLEVFDKISDRTQAFYTEKGLSVANYDELVANVADKRAAAELQVAAVSDVSTEIDCETEDPKAVAAAFKETMKAQITALKDYRTAVKDLIVGVRTGVEATEEDATEETEGGTETPDATEPTETEPEATESTETEGAN